MKARKFLTFLCSGALAAQLWAADPNGTLSTEQIQELRQKIEEQQKQIEALQNSIAAQKQMLDQASHPDQASHVDGAPHVNAASPAPAQAVATSIPAAHPQTANENAESPISLRLGAASFTPLGFLDFTYVGRSTNVGSGIGTNFGSIPYNTSASGRVGENTLSAQNSRLGLRVDSNVKGAKVLGYVEADFLGNQPTNVFVTSNADTFRLRAFFADVKKGPFEVMGGQDWSLMTPGRTGISPVPSDIFYTQNMDTNYQLGLIWARQSQFRFGYHPNANWHFVLSLENPQQYIGGSAGAPTITYPSAFANNTSITNQFNNGTNNFSVPNAGPDVILKAAYDAKPHGLTQHIEVAGLLRRFRYFNPTVEGGAGRDFSAVGGGGSVNGNFEIFKNFHLVANTFFSDGGGRYIFGLAPDLVLRPNGDISLVHSYSTVDGFEANVKKNLLLYAYYGGAYVGKNVAQDANGTFVGYGYSGAPASTAAAQNRSLQEVTIGLTPTIWKSEQYGALQIITQYSYVWRNPWYLAQGNPSNAKTNMVFVDLRYVLP
jgi:hypothetical protein